MEKLKLRELIFAALFVALITAGTFIKIPAGGDVYTLQFLFTLLAGLILGEKLGTLAVAVYVLMGLIGIPVFASGGGPGYLFQPTFGFATVKKNAADLDISVEKLTTIYE